MPFGLTPLIRQLWFSINTTLSLRRGQQVDNNLCVSLLLIIETAEAVEVTGDFVTRLNVVVTFSKRVQNMDRFVTGQVEAFFRQAERSRETSGSLDVNEPHRPDINELLVEYNSRLDDHYDDFAEAVAADKRINDFLPQIASHTIFDIYGSNGPGSLPDFAG
ncbi:MAG: hypothetical protein K2Z81_12840, partial [Cyanobacteria bacterium]|nr:hypothetical protein [Cyanobacteriota bacterium]